MSSLSSSKKKFTIYRLAFTALMAALVLSLPNSILKYHWVWV